MKLVVRVLGLFVNTTFLILAIGIRPSLVHAETCKWGLGYGSQEVCEAKEALAASRMARAKTICYSGDSGVQWNKHDKSFNPNSMLELRPDLSKKEETISIA